MSKLEIAGRPWTVFDASNFEHRQEFAKFLKNRTWGGCPYRFIIESEYGDLISMIQKKLIDHYTNVEFG